MDTRVLIEDMIKTIDDNVSQLQSAVVESGKNEFYPELIHATFHPASKFDFIKNPESKEQFDKGSEELEIPEGKLGLVRVYVKSKLDEEGDERFWTEKVIEIYPEEVIKEVLV